MSINSVEASVQYNRQIHLWGLESQIKINNSKIAVIGLNGFTCEVCKDIVLAGVGLVAVCQSGTIDENDVETQFFISSSDIGKNKAQVWASKLSELNNLVKVAANSDNLIDKSDEDLEKFFKDFDLVFVSSTSLNFLNRVNNITRKLGILFSAGSCFGFYGYIFSDFLEYSYKPDHTKGDMKKCSYVPVSKVFHSHWTTLTNYKKIHKLYFAIQVLFIFKEKFDRLPLSNSHDEEALVKLKNELLTSQQLSTEFILDSYIKSVGHSSISEISPVCSIVAGFAGKQIISAITRVNIPIDNLFLYTAMEQGIIETIY